jgi:hypothetical protein
VGGTRRGGERASALEAPPLTVDHLLDALLWLRTCDGLDGASPGAAPPEA